MFTSLLESYGRLFYSHLLVEYGRQSLAKIYPATYQEADINYWPEPDKKDLQT